jgi:hypothetical protein
MKPNLILPIKKRKNIIPIIPLHVYMTWKSNQMPPLMQQNFIELCKKNPEFQFHLYDNDACREFIINHFPEEVIQAYDGLIPGAYKADLWRLCVLYIHGGIYMDIKLACVNGFKLIELTENEHLVKDRTPHKLEILNTLMVCKKGNILLYKGIRQIVENVKNKFYGNSALDPTGPGLLGNIIEQNNLRSNIDMTHFIGGNYIIYKKRFVITTVYPEYHQERDQTYDNINTKRYDALWDEKKIIETIRTPGGKRMYNVNKYPNSDEIYQISLKTNLTTKKVKTWFDSTRFKLKHSKKNNFTPKIVNFLMSKYEANDNPSRNEILEMANEMKLSETQVYHWFRYKRQAGK